ncbi:Sorting nexin mvp1 [Myotisia sp. PD_48]|nr:Sorting nexin mvp1 [Myotisia sp. PD_48]
MSLFGTSPDDSGSHLPKQPASPSSRTRSNLFTDESSSLFGVEEGFSEHNSSTAFNNFDNTAGGDHDSSSPWSMPSPRKSGGRQQIVRTLLPQKGIPEGYVDAYDALVEAKGGINGSGISVEEAKKLLSSTHLSEEEKTSILNTVTNDGKQQTLERNEFNVFLALVGLAQEGEDITLDSVDERKKRLPTPNIPYIERLKSRNELNGTSASPSRSPSNNLASPPSQPRRKPRQYSFDPEMDPWGSPAPRRTKNRSTSSGINGYHPSVEQAKDTTVSKTPGSHRTQTEAHNAGETISRESGQAPGGDGSGWGGGNYGQSAGTAFGGSHSQAGLEGGFDASGDDQGDSDPNPLARSLGGGRLNGTAVGDVISIHMLPEKEGLFLFQHRNYEVKSSRRATSVIRRYSDFVWLVDCLQKRFPFRQIPLLPPKRVSVNGTHLAADSNSFLDKRRRGLVRFANALVSHPVLSQEQLVVMFFTVPTELAVWKKQASVSVQEEFNGKALPPDLEDSLPPTLTDTFDTVRSGVRRSAEIYINLCNLLDRLVKRNQGVAAEYFRVSRALQSLTESTPDTYAVDTNDVPLLNNGINSTAKHLLSSQGLLEDEARAWDMGVLEDFKGQRDCLVAMRDLFDRRDRYAKDNIPQLEKRIETNERKLQELRTRGEGTVKTGEAEKLEDAIFKDKESIVQQHARGVFIKECIRDELFIFQTSQYRISQLHQDWSQERVKYAELQADNWRALTTEVEAMPTSE